MKPYIINLSDVKGEIAEDMIIGGTESEKDFWERQKIYEETAEYVERFREFIKFLSPNQALVMRLLADGYTIKEIASELEKSPQTISTHKQKALRKLRRWFNHG